MTEAALKARGSNVPQTRARKLKALHQVATGSPEIPEWLTEDERAIWKAIAPTLLDMGIISVADSASLGRYCHALAEWVQVAKDLRGQPRLVKPESAPAYQNPLIKIRADLAKEIQSLEDRFGLTPAARMTLNVTALFTPGYKPHDQPTKPTDPTSSPSA
jgi:P27 family predicted phage terminase small subunit